MIKVTNELLDNLETLSALQIKEEKKEEIMQQLNEIIAFVENLNELDTSTIDGFFSTLEGQTPLRKDQVVQDEAIKTIINYAPQTEDNFFIVPAIIE